MSVRQRNAVLSAITELRHEPIDVRIRADIDGATVVDTTHAVLVWEPRRFLCEYTVPTGDLAGELTARRDEDAPPEPGPGLLGSAVPFAVHTAEGTAYDVHVGNRVLPGAAFRPADPDLDDLVMLDFDAFDAWYQEDEPNIGHPRDPYHRIDIYPSSRRVRVTANGTLLAESTRPTVLFETMLPPRFYLPQDDVLVALDATATSTACPYKGWASYWSADVEGTPVDDVAWAYVDPIADCEQIRGMVCFDDAKVTVTVDPA